MKNLIKFSLILSTSLIAIPAFSASFSNVEICKAAISMEFAKEPKIMKTKVNGDLINLQYHRPSDNSLWKYQCKMIEGSRVLWRSAGSDSEPNYIGRWRDNPNDALITYTEENGVLKMTNSQAGEQTFKHADLK
ncbi:hypothetical protein [Dickeya dadantii]|uniref:Uncharacterized protein n=1 Tax=Dickeya dadantii (strain 3937) TaxID=198628 RepID=E0SIC0_DICD3|nr:hypothetical protein [Dickeya dadantii]ADM96634.1 hypothetical protein Dda3937_01310 [Dickeya dadantii 3937]